MTDAGGSTVPGSAGEDGDVVRPVMPVAPDVGSEVLRRELDRVAVRLRVLGPRWAGRGGAGQPQADAVRSALQELADLGADVEGRTHREVPVLGPHALPDQLLVLGQDVLAADDPGAVHRAHDLLVALRRAL